MFLRKLLVPGKKEQLVLESFTEHLKLLYSALDLFKKAIEAQDKELMESVVELEREADAIRRNIIAKIYEGAFLPYLRPNLCRFAEIVDEVFDLLEDASYQYMESPLHESITTECGQIATLNLNMGEMLLMTFEALMKGDDLREKSLAIRIYEKKVDDIKFDLFKELKGIEVNNFWEGKMLSDFVASLTHISDVIEDAGDYLQVINVSMR